MSRRKKRKEPDEIEEIPFEDTQEMWVVADAPTEDPPEADELEDDRFGDEDDRFHDEDEADRFDDEDEIDPDQEFADEEFADEEGEEFEEEEAGEFTDDEELDEDGDDWHEGEIELGEDWYEEEIEPGEDDRFEDDDLFEEFDEPEVPAPSLEEKPRKLSSLRSRLQAINLPDIPDPDPRHLLAAVGVAAVALAVGFGTHELGKKSGDDLDAARLQGEAAGRQAGAIEGAVKGYPAGFQKGRESGFERAYTRNYRIHYRRAFEQAGLDVPRDRDIDVPAP